MRNVEVQIVAGSFTIIPTHMSATSIRDADWFIDTSQPLMSLRFANGDVGKGMVVTFQCVAWYCGLGVR